MPLLKPTRGLEINLAQPMARGLVACWLLNEGTGPTVCDLSKNRNQGAVQGVVPRAPGVFGASLDFPNTGNTNYVQISNAKGFASAGTFVWWANLDTIVGYGGYISARDAANSNTVLMLLNTTEGLRCYHFNTANSQEVNFTTPFSSTGVWTQFAYTWSSAEPAAKLYINGVYKNQEPTISGTLRTPELIWLGTDRQISGRGLDGRIDHVLGWNRVLSASEIAHLYREPFCIFQPKVSPGLLSAPAGQIVSLAGTCAAGTDVTGLLKVICRCAGAIAAGSDVTALLKVIYRCAGAIAAHSGASASLTLVGQVPPAQEWFAGSLNIEQDWLLAALLGGMTANAFKLGTVLSLGWFWMRRSGCSVLYRGPAMDQIDFTNALTVAEQDAGQISPPLYVAHGSSSTYFYAVRRVNTCGYREHTLAAVAKVAIDADGNLAAPQPNNIFAAAVRQVNGNKVRLTWFYCPLRQKSKPICFRIYHDAASGQVDYQNPIGTITYQGQRFYSCLTEPLAGGRYLFAIRAEDADGVQNGSLARSKIQLVTEIPEAVDILSAESL
jgi:hypothetical protein